jgi:hypothetical protein
MTPLLANLITNSPIWQSWGVGNFTDDFVLACVGIATHRVLVHFRVYTKIKNWLFKEVHEEHRKAEEHRKWSAAVLKNIHLELVGKAPPEHPHAERWDSEDTNG